MSHVNICGSLMFAQSNAHASSRRGYVDVCFSKESPCLKLVHLHGFLSSAGDSLHDWKNAASSGLHIPVLAYQKYSVRSL